MTTSNIVNIFKEKPIIQPTKQQLSDYAGNKHKLFTVESSCISDVNGIIADRKSLSVNKKSINIVSDNYKIHQPTEIYEQFQTAVESHNLSIDKVLCNPNTGGMLLSSHFETVDFIGGDKHNVDLVFYTCHNGMRKTFLTLNTLRIACENQLPALYGSKDHWLFSEKHYKKSLDAKHIGDIVREIPEKIAAHNKNLEQLASTKMTKDQFLKSFIEFYKIDIDTKRWINRKSEIMNVYESAEGQDIAPSNTAYKALQAVTYINSHQAKKSINSLESINITKTLNSAQFAQFLLAA